MKLTLTDEQRREVKLNCQRKGWRVAPTDREIDDIAAALPEPELAEPTEAEIKQAARVWQDSPGISVKQIMAVVLQDFIARRKRPASKRDRLIALINERLAKREYAANVDAVALADAILGGE